MLVKNYMLRDITSVYEDMGIDYIMKLLNRQKREVLPVVNRTNHVIGCIGIGHILAAINRSRLSGEQVTGEVLSRVRSQKVSELMSGEVYTTAEDSSILEALSMIFDHKLSTMYVVDEQQQLTGLLNSADLFAQL